MRFSKGRLSWEVLIAGAIMGLLGAISQHFGWQASACLLRDNVHVEWTLKGE